jgi:hypothetical protein
MECEFKIKGQGIRSKRQELKCQMIKWLNFPFSTLNGGVNIYYIYEFRRNKRKGQAIRR